MNLFLLLEEIEKTPPSSSLNKNLYISVEVRFCFFNLIDIFDAKPISIRVVIKPPSDLS